MHLRPLALLPLIALAGCSTHLAPTTASPAALRISGTLHGGQQPISGAHIFLYAANATAYAGASRSMLSAPGFVTTDNGGNFSITGAYACQTGDLVYLLATGGNSGSGANTSIAELTALGPCAPLAASPQTVSINEVTTVASVFALSAYMSGPTNIGAPASDANGLTNAFANVANMVNTATGFALTAPPSAAGTVPQTAINSLANSIAACVNSTTGSAACTSLFSATTANSVTPADTVTATLQIALHPNLNTTTIYNLAGATPPFQPTLATAPSDFAIAVTFNGDYLTFHHDAMRSGVQPTETTLTPANVNSTTFGKLRTFSTDGFNYAAPLFLSGYTMSDGVKHNVVFTETSHDSVYAFDADGNNPAAGNLWHVQLVNSGEVPVAQTDYFGCPNPTPEAGIVGTPVIDRTSGTMYVVARTKNTSAGTFIQRLHALSLADGSEKFGGPVTITASVPGTGDGTSGGNVAFDALHENERAALLLKNGTVWIVWASHCDINPYHGWVMGYNANTLTRTYLYNNTPNGSEGGIWMAEGGPAADAQGNIYIVNGNGTFDVDTGGSDYGDTIQKLTPSPTSTTLTIADWFAPSNQLTLSQQDNDIGVSQSLLFDDPATNAGLAVITDKTGRVYLLNRNNLGHYDTGSNGPDGKNGDLQDFTCGTSIFNQPTWFNGTMYLGCNGVPLRAYTYINGTGSSPGTLNLTPASTAPTTFGSSGGASGTTPTISANGTANAIVWCLERAGANAILHAYLASNLATELYNSAQAPSSRDLGPSSIKFSSPTVGGGKVFVPGTTSIVVYGLF